MIQEVTRMDEEGYDGIPLSPGFMVTSIIGFFISMYVIYPRWADWGFALLLFFVIMFIASIISMSRTPIEAREHLRHSKRKE